MIHLYHILYVWVDRHTIVVISDTDEYGADVEDFLKQYFPRVDIILQAPAEYVLRKHEHIIRRAKPVKMEKMHDTLTWNVLFLWDGTSLTPVPLGRVVGRHSYGLVIRIGMVV